MYVYVIMYKYTCTIYAGFLINPQSVAEYTEDEG